ncbi:MAG: polyphosphate polymerase domain-containing protein [Planctomycetes bacterium]|nr:polyphosphate polymerase domain-containing protein [Planctomycetota bacterium]MCC7395710.1 polyphosphate polymerase domain-containing protein [Planctomycetota bacterium]
MSYQNRYECKFVVSEAVAGRVLQRVLLHVDPDPHAAAHTDLGYPIASLYLDDELGSFYQETVEGRRERYKLRVRSYSDDPATPVWLEVKRRVDGVVQKQRGPLPRDELAAVLAGDEQVLTRLPAADRPAVAEFIRLCRQRRAAPRCLVRYQRQAFVGRDDRDVRITFDRRLAAAVCHDAIVPLRDPRYVEVPTGGVVLELKFDDREPRWLNELVQQVELRRRSFSKYCNSLDSLQPITRRQG